MKVSEHDVEGFVKKYYSAIEEEATKGNEDAKYLLHIYEKYTRMSGWGYLLFQAAKEWAEEFSAAEKDPLHNHGW